MEDECVTKESIDKADVAKHGYEYWFFVLKRDCLTSHSNHVDKATAECSQVLAPVVWESANRISSNNTFSKYHDYGSDSWNYCIVCVDHERVHALHHAGLDGDCCVAPWGH